MALGWKYGMKNLTKSNSAMYWQDKDIEERSSCQVKCEGHEVDTSKMENQRLKVNKEKSENGGRWTEKKRDGIKRTSLMISRVIYRVV